MGYGIWDMGHGRGVWDMGGLRWPVPPTSPAVTNVLCSLLNPNPTNHCRAGFGRSVKYGASFSRLTSSPPQIRPVAAGSTAGPLPLSRLTSPPPNTHTHNPTCHRRFDFGRSAAPQSEDEAFATPCFARCPTRQLNASRTCTKIQAMEEAFPYQGM
eukprot:363412-Chlamydomonas_euryale.AAC.3